MKRNYQLYKSRKKRNCQIDYKRLEGFKVKPLNKVTYEGVLVNELIIIYPEFIEKVLKKKVKRKLNYFLKLVIAIIEDDNDSDPSVIDKVLDDLERYRRRIRNNYQKHLDEKYIELLLTKVSLLENELKSKIVYKPLEMESKKKK